MIKKKKILLVDDEKDLVEELSLRLEASDWEVLTATNGQEGLEKAKKEKPDLILLDIVMNEMNGYQVCHDLKSGLQTQSIPIIVLTARTQKSDKDWAQECKADDYMIKPYEIDLLLQKIRQHLGEKQ